MYLKTFKALLVTFCIVAVSAVSWSTNSFAGDPGSLEQEIQDLKEQNRMLTERLKGVEQSVHDLQPRHATTMPTHEAEGHGGFLSALQNHINIEGLIEFGAAYRSTDMNHGTHQHDSDLALTTVELAIEAEVNEWVSVETVLLYEDPTFVNEESSLDVDEAIITIANSEVTPIFVKAGKMAVPFGAYLEHFPDDPFIGTPVTLLMGETIEKALLVGTEYEGFTFSTYVFNGDVEEGGDNVIESYGFDANYAMEDESQGMDLLVGASYISNIADSDHIEHHVSQVDAYTSGAGAYLHVGIQGFFFDAEYMAATEEFGNGELHTGSTGQAAAKPEVWNFEAGYNYDWWRNLEIAVKVAGSDDGEGLGFPRERYGINFNQEIFDDTVLSVGYIYDYYDKDDHGDRNTEDLVFTQLAVEF